MDKVPTQKGGKVVTPDPTFEVRRPFSTPRVLYEYLPHDSCLALYDPKFVLPRSSTEVFSRNCITPESSLTVPPWPYPAFVPALSVDHLPTCSGFISDWSFPEEFLVSRLWVVVLAKPFWPGMVLSRFFFYIIPESPAVVRWSCEYLVASLRWSFRVGVSPA